MPLVVSVRKSAKLPAYVDAPIPEPALRRENVIAGRHIPTFSRAYLSMVRGLLTPGVKSDLLDAMREADAGRMTIEEVVNVVPWWNPADPLSNMLWTMLAARVETAYTQTIEDAGESEYRAQGWPIKFEVQKQIQGDPRRLFVPINPFSARYIRTRSAKLVAEASADQKSLIRAILSKGFAEGRRPISILEQIEQVVGLTEREWGYVSRRDDLLAETGMPDDARKTAVDRYADQLLSKRARRIGRTETVDAYSKGLEDSWDIAKDSGIISGAQVYKVWVELTASPRTCKICRGLGRQPAPLGQSFVSDIIGEIDRPPAHPHCRCTMILFRPGDDDAAFADFVDMDAINSLR